MAQAATASEIMSKDFFMVRPSDPATEVMGSMRKQRLSAGIVYDKGYQGLVTKDSFLKFHTDLGSVFASSLKVTTPTLTKDSGILEAAEMMYGSEVRMLPVIEKDKVIGIVKAEDLVQQIKSMPALRSLRAEDVGKKNPVTIKKDATVAQAMSVMRKSGVGRLPMVDDSGNLAGIVSLADIMGNYLLKPVASHGGYRGRARTSTSVRAKGFEPAKNRVLEEAVVGIATTSISTASPDATLAEILSLMQKQDIADVVLVRGGRLAGIITMRDLLRAILSTNVEHRKLQMVNLPELDLVDRSAFEHSIAETYDKLERILNNEIELKLHVKTEDVEGMRKMYSVHCKLTSPGVNITATSTKKWKFLVCAQDALRTLESEVIKKVKRPPWKEHG